MWEVVEERRAQIMRALSEGADSAVQWAEIEQAASRLKSGGLVAFPTETVYGLGACAWNAEAIRQVFVCKGRPADNPLIVHLSHPSEISSFALEIPASAVRLIHAFWPGPLTLILPKKPEVLDLLTGGLDSVALRMPAHPVALALIEASGPLVAPSANRSGRPSPTHPAHVRHDLGPDVMVIGDAPCTYGLESTVLDLTTTPAILCRPGHLGAQELSAVLGEPVVSMTSALDGHAPRSPGMKYTHYSPNAEVRWAKPSIHPPSRTLWLVHSSVATVASKDIVATVASKDIVATVASEDIAVVDYAGDFVQMARELYDRFRQADLEGRPCVWIEPLPPPPHDGVIAALFNRITKAIG